MVLANGDRSAAPSCCDGDEEPASAGRLVVVSNRVADLSAGHQAGGLAVALAESLGESGGIWFGWSGEIAPELTTRQPTSSRSAGVTTATIALDPEEHESYYHRLRQPRALAALPLPPRSGRPSTGAVGDGYAASTAASPRRCAPLLEPDDTIWVHDYHLIPLAALSAPAAASTNRSASSCTSPFRRRRSSRRCRNHQQFERASSPTTSSASRPCATARTSRATSIEQLDCRRLDDGRLKGFGRSSTIDAFPIGIDAEDFAAEAERSRARRSCAALRDRTAGHRDLIVGVDRLDYSKGLPERFRGSSCCWNASRTYAAACSSCRSRRRSREGVEAYEAIRTRARAA